MTTFRAAIYNGIALTSQQEFAPPEEALVVDALAEAHRPASSATPTPRVTERVNIPVLPVAQWFGPALARVEVGPPQGEDFARGAYDW